MFEVKKSVSMHTVRGELTNWLELGGDETWVRIVNHKLPENTTLSDFRPGGKFNPSENYENTLSVIATTEGGELIVTCEEDDAGNELKDYTLNLEKIQQGLQVMANKYAHHFSNMVNEDGDMTTSSVFVQCCLFGEVVFC